jgi:hypothetical protein
VLTISSGRGNYVWDLGYVRGLGSEEGVATSLSVAL